MGEVILSIVPCLSSPAPWSRPRPREVRVRTVGFDVARGIAGLVEGSKGLQAGSIRPVRPGSRAGPTPTSHTGILQTGSLVLKAPEKVRVMKKAPASPQAGAFARLGPSLVWGRD
ncbi:hypothetical protein GCM10023081_22830 [Arthrobacter ginkgonis]|uniref:Uncharacterized protein n=1 Tax=Arthrobacter ginkgonis TaxID=1630594 RepID=A0ABP7C9V0_9MICC